MSRFSESEKLDFAFELGDGLDLHADVLHFLEVGKSISRIWYTDVFRFCASRDCVVAKLPCVILSR